MKRIIKIVAFISIFIILWIQIFKVYWLPATSITNFYKEPKNSIDVAYFGASNAYAHFNTVYAFNKYGFATGMMSTDAQPFIAIKFLLKEVQKRQNPKVYVIDISGAAGINLEEAQIRKVTDSMPFSLNKLEAIDYLLSRSAIPKEDYINYYFSFLTYHSFYNNITKNNFKYDVLYKGYLLDSGTSSIQSQNKPNWNKDEREELSIELKDGFQDLINYILDNKLEILFVLSPRIYSDDTMKILNTMIKMCKDNNLKVLNFMESQPIDIDYSHDLYNYAHLNVWGATKFTSYLGKYLKDNYDLDDHRGNKKYISWEKEYERFKEDFKKYTKEDFDKLEETII